MIYSFLIFWARFTSIAASKISWHNCKFTFLARIWLGFGAPGNPDSASDHSGIAWIVVFITTGSSPWSFRQFAPLPILSFFLIHFSLRTSFFKSWPSSTPYFWSLKKMIRIWRIFMELWIYWIFLVKLMLKIVKRNLTIFYGTLNFRVWLLGL